MSRPRPGERGAVTDEELSQATSTIERWYRQWAQSTANDLMRSFFDGEISDREALYDRTNEVTDSAMTYNVDQSRTLFASDSVDEAMQEVEGMGGGGDNAQAVLAVTTFQIDVRNAFPDDLHEFEDLDLFERQVWLAENHGELLTKLGEAAELYMLTDSAPGVSDYAVLLLNHEDETGTLVSAQEAIRGEDRDVAGLVAGYLQQHGDPETQVLVDRWLENPRSR